MNPSSVQPPLPVAAPAPQPIEQPLPDIWPGAFKIYKFSERAVKFNLKPILIIYLMIIVFSVAGTLLPGESADNSASIVNYYLQTLIFIACLAGVRQQKISTGQTFKAFFADGVWWKLALASVASGFLLVIAFLLLIVPGFILLPRLALIFGYIIDKKAGPIEAIKLSIAATKGHSLKFWGIIGASFVMVLPALTVIGIPVTFYLLFMYSAVYMVLYEFLVNHPSQSLVSPAGTFAPQPVAAVPGVAPQAPVYAAPEQAQPIRPVAPPAPQAGFAPTPPPAIAAQPPVYAAPEVAVPTPPPAPVASQPAFTPAAPAPITTPAPDAVRPDITPPSPTPPVV